MAKSSSEPTWTVAELSRLEDLAKAGRKLANALAFRSETAPRLVDELFTIEFDIAGVAKGFLEKAARLEAPPFPSRFADMSGVLRRAGELEDLEAAAFRSRLSAEWLEEPVLPPTERQAGLDRLRRQEEHLAGVLRGLRFLPDAELFRMLAQVAAS